LDFGALIHKMTKVMRLTAASGGAMIVIVADFLALHLCSCSMMAVRQFASPRRKNESKGLIILASGLAC
jgi:hypothetical protein